MSKSFENYLTKVGYEKQAYNFELKKWETTNKTEFSTMGTLGYKYVDHNTRVAMHYGLHEKNKPPTLIAPRPKIILKQVINGAEVTKNELSDDAMNAVFNNFTSEQIYNAIFDENTTLIINI
jgi:hypothetical protein